MVEGLIRHLTPEMLLLLDQGFSSYELWRRLESTGVKLLVRVVKTLILRPIRTLADGSYLAKVYKSDSDRKKDRDGVVVRVIRYTLDDPQRVGHGQEHILITNLFDEEIHPTRELIILYHERWEEEVTFDEQKTHQDPRRATKPAHLRSETPRRSDPGDLCVVAGPFRGPITDVRGRRDGGAGPGRAVVHGLLSDPEMPAAGMHQPDSRDV